jgi:hypothetical protein
VEYKEFHFQIDVQFSPHEKPEQYVQDERFALSNHHSQLREIKTNGEGFARATSDAQHFEVIPHLPQISTTPLINTKFQHLDIQLISYFLSKSLSIGEKLTRIFLIFKASAKTKLKINNPHYLCNEFEKTMLKAIEPTGETRPQKLRIDFILLTAKFFRTLDKTDKCYKKELTWIFSELAKKVPKSGLLRAIYEQYNNPYSRLRNAILNPNALDSPQVVLRTLISYFNPPSA